MNKYNVNWLVFIGLVIGPLVVSAQTQPRGSQQFIESSSPVKGGGVVTTRYTPGASARTVTTFAQPTGQRSNNLSGAQSGLSANNSRFRSVMRVPQTGNQAPAVARNLANRNSLNGTYSYPTPIQPRLALAQPQLGFPIVNRGYSGRSVYQVPTLGILATRQTAYRTAQNCCAVPAQSQAASSPPSLNIQVPGDPGFNSGVVAGSQNSVFQNPGYRNPANSAYQPLFRLKNMPAGTYLGQGIIGQPTAYVDGQPIRNLLRYISP